MEWEAVGAVGQRIDEIAILASQVSKARSRARRLFYNVTPGGKHPRSCIAITSAARLILANREERSCRNVSVRLQLIKKSFDFRADDNGGVEYDDGVGNDDFGPALYGYDVSKGGVLTVTMNSLSHGCRSTFTMRVYGPNAWASLYGTEQSSIDDMDNDEFKETLELATQTWLEIELELANE